MINDIVALFNFSPVLFLSTMAVIGLFFGSFLNVVISRLPQCFVQIWRNECYEFLEIDQKQDTRNPLLVIMTPRSSCPQCHNSIKAYDNIPLFSYLILRGKCRSCKKEISLKYPIVEFISAICCLIIAYSFGPTWQTVAGCILTWVLIAQSFIDLENTFIPDEITLPMIWIGLLVSLVPVFADIQSSLIGAISGYLSLWAIYWIFFILTGKEGMGYGDFKLLAMIGAWLGWQVLPFVILFASAIGAIIGVTVLIVKKQDRNTKIPFGPFLAFAGFVAMLWGADINQWYLHYAGIY